METTDTLAQIGGFLRLLYTKAATTGHADRFPLREIADELGLPIGLAIKLSKYLEHQGLIDFESGGVDITIDGMLRVEKALEPKV